MGHFAIAPDLRPLPRYDPGRFHPPWPTPHGGHDEQVTACGSHDGNRSTDIRGTGDAPVAAVAAANPPNPQGLRSRLPPASTLANPTPPVNPIHPPHPQPLQSLHVEKQSLHEQNLDGGSGSAMRTGAAPLQTSRTHPLHPHANLILPVRPSSLLSHGAAASRGYTVGKRRLFSALLEPRCPHPPLKSRGICISGQRHPSLSDVEKRGEREGREAPEPRTLQVHWVEDFPWSRAPLEYHSTSGLYVR